jgi:hypothetical protein
VAGIARAEGKRRGGKMLGTRVTLSVEKEALIR